MAGAGVVATKERRSAHALQPAGDSGKRKYFDSKTGRNVVRVLPGDQYICEHPDEMLVTILGSCISACVRDPRSGIGGMNHFMLPQSDSGMWNQTSASLRYGNHAMESLLNEMVKRGCPREKVEIKVFGGSNVIRGAVTQIGDRNCAFIKHYLSYEGLQCKAFDLGGPHPRRIHFFPDSGRVMRLFLKRSDDVRMLEEETSYRSRIEKAPIKSDIELFG